jgi:hypothetical protein
MTGKHYSLASEMIRTITKTCRAIDALAVEEPERAAEVTRALDATLRAAQSKLTKIKLPPVRATRWQGITRANVSFVKTQGDHT